ncbi:MAG: hypothetical protein H0W08_05295 [Acidobacteria bacterium]|nr:hypothetical protein [Acidobacteriota bacterium]
MARACSAGTSITPFEVVFPGTRLEVTLEEAWDPRDAQSGVVVDGVRGRVDVRRRGRTARWTPLETLPPGPHYLRANGQVTPFFLTDSVAKVPSTVRIHAVSRVRVHARHVERLRSDQRPAGRFLEFMKGVHRRTGAPVSLAFDQTGTPVEGAAVLGRIAEARARTYGKRDPGLHARMQSGTRDLPVAIWLRCDEALAPEPRPRRGRAPKPGAQVHRREAAVAKVTRVFPAKMAESRLGRAARADRLAPIVHARLTPGEIARLEPDERVVGLFLADPTGRVDLTYSVAIARADAAHAEGARRRRQRRGVGRRTRSAEPTDHLRPLHVSTGHRRALPADPRGHP